MRPLNTLLIAVTYVLLVELPTFAQESGEMLRFDGAPNLELDVTSAALQKVVDGVLFESAISQQSVRPFDRILFNGTIRDSNLVLQVRYRQLEGEWSDWQNTRRRVFKNGRFWARLDIAEAANKMQYRFLDRGITVPARIEIYAVEVLLMGKQPKPGEGVPKLQQEQIFFFPNDSIPQPPIFTRDQWGANPPIGIYVPHSPFRFTQHHTAGRRVSTLEDGLDEQRFIQDFHQNGRGWQDIGYHFCMDDSGRIYEGVPPDFRGTHVGGNNTGNIGISLFGNFEIDGEFSTDKSLESLVEIWSWLSFDYIVNPDSLFGHRDYNPTACPGKNVYPELVGLRDGIRKALGFGAPFVVNPMPQPFSREVNPSTDIVFFIRDDEEGVDANGIILYVNNQIVIPTISGDNSQYQVSYLPPVHFPNSQNVLVRVEAADLAVPPNQMEYSFQFTIQVQALYVELETGITMRNASLEIAGIWPNDDNDVILPNLNDGRRLVTTDHDGSHVARIFPEVPEPGDYRILMAINTTFLGESARYQFVNAGGSINPHFAEYNDVYLRKWGTLSPTPVHFDTSGSETGYIELSGSADFSTRLVLDALRLEKVDRLDPPTAPALKWVRRMNAGSGQIEVAWYPTLEGDIRGYRLFMSEDGRTWDEPLVDEEVLGKGADHYVVNYGGNSPKLYFRMVAVDTNTVEIEGQPAQALLSNPTDTYGVGLVSEAEILVVDNFDRRASWPLPYHPFVRSHGDALNASGYGFDSCTETAVQNGEIHLSDYEAVIYLCGDDSRADESLAAADQWRLLEYMEQGGKLFISGSEIGYDFDETISTEKQRYENLLKATYEGDISGSNQVIGEAGTTFGGMEFTYGTMSTGDTYFEDFPDYILPNGGSEVALIYDNLRIAAVQYSGTYGKSEQEARLIYMAFPFETIENPGDRAEVMARAMEYFDIQTDVAGELSSTPERFELGRNYPNPFNLGSSNSSSKTTIDFSLPGPERVTLFIYNILGQRIATLTEAQFSAGRHQVTWDGRSDNGLPAASGTYLYRLEAGDFRMTRKLLLVR